MQGGTIMIDIYDFMGIQLNCLLEFAEQVFLLNFHSFFKQICSALHKQALGFYSSALTALMLPHVCCHMFAATCLLQTLKPLHCHAFALWNSWLKNPTHPHPLPPTISLPPHPPHQSLQQASQRNLFNEVSWFARTLMIAFQSKYSLFLYSLFLLSEH